MTATHPRVSTAVSVRRMGFICVVSSSTGRWLIFGRSILRSSVPRAGPPGGATGPARSRAARRRGLLEEAPQAIAGDAAVTDLEAEAVEVAAVGDRVAVEAATPLVGQTVVHSGAI